ncbi:alcohol dehydrogenase, partial [Bacillus paralicheniformis]|nr:alcohol dehydrogenase [Bacillus paralicheniformis]
PNGHFLTIGLLSGIQVNWAEIVTKVKVHANLFHLRHWNKEVSPYKWQETFRHLIRLVENEQLRFMKVHSTYGLADVKAAVDVVQSAEKTKGKVFLTNY